MSATLGLDTSAYEAGVRSVQSETKKTVTALSSEYTKATKRVSELAKAYADSVEKSGKSSKATKDLKTQLNAAQAEVKTLASALNTANSNMVTFSSKASSAGQSLTGALTKASLLSSALQKLGGAAVDMATAFVKSGISYNMEIEKYQTAYSNMLGSAEAASEAIANLQEDAARTPFDVSTLVKANQYLISSGENAAYARETILALGDAVSAAGGGSDELNRMAQNLQQVANAGKATAMDIRQFAYAGINIYQILSDYTGKTVQEVQDMEISYELLSAAFISASEEGGRYYDSMSTQSQTTSGKIATLKDNFTQLTGTLTDDLQPAINDVVDWLNKVTVSAKDAYDTEGWYGLIGAITGLKSPMDSAKDWFNDFYFNASNKLDKLSWQVAKFFDDLWGGSSDFVGNGYDTYEEYRKSTQQSKYDANAGSKDEKYWKEYTERLKKQYGISEDSGTVESSITGNGGGGGTNSGTSVENVIRSLSKTTTSKTLNELGVVTQTVETLSEKVKDESGKIKDRITTTTTETGKEMVNGVETTYKTITTKVNGETTKVVKIYDDMSKSVVKTLANLATQTIAGITTMVQTTTQIAADGSEQEVKTVTETGERIVDGVAQTYTTITKYIDGVVDSVQESCEEVERTVKVTQERIDGYTSKIQTEANSGIFGLLKSSISAVQSQDWQSLATNVAKLVFGEVDQGQREIVEKWAGDALAIINEKYAGGGISGALGAIVDLFTDGITPAANEASASVKGFGEILTGLSASGGVGAVLGGIGTKLLEMGGAVVSFVAANPWVAAVAAIAAGAAGLGVYIWKKHKSSATDTTSSSGIGYKDIQDAYWYGNERAFAGYDYRTDPYTYNPNNSAVMSYQSKMQAQIERLCGVVEQYLPDVAKAQIVLDDGTLVGAMASGMDAQLGTLAVLAERGN